jgi:multicomponent Na+:H+ antiporter subunit D
MAIAQTELKRMLAYSSVAQIAYIGLGIGMASTLGLIGAILHVLNHALMKACLFLVAGNLRAQVGHSSIPRFDEPLRTMMPWTMASFTIGALSMIGIPPTAGFFSKWYLVLAGIGDSRWIFVVIIMLSSLLSIVYFFRILERVYMRSEKKNKSTQHYPLAVKANEGSPLMVVPTVVLAISLIVVGLVNVFFVETIIRPMLPPGL